MRTAEGMNAHPRAAVGVLLALLPGCYLLHGSGHGDAPPEVAPPVSDGGPVLADAAWPERDAGAGPDRDAGDSPADAGSTSDGAYWSLIEREAYVYPEPAQCGDILGASAFARVVTGIHGMCEYGAPATVERVDGGYLVRGHVWVHHVAEEGTPPCEWVTAIAERDVPFLLQEGVLEARGAGGGSTVVFAPSAERAHACSMEAAIDEPCAFDCDCAPGLHCVQPPDDPFAFPEPECAYLAGTCQRPCNPTGDSLGRSAQGRTFDCPVGERCVATSETVTPVCEPLAGDLGCAEHAECPDGMSCADDPPDCVFSADPTGAACVADHDCLGGTRCVEHADGARRCELPCFTANQRCPHGMRCRAPRWVCEVAD